MVWGGEVGRGGEGRVGSTMDWSGMKWGLGGEWDGVGCSERGERRH